MMPESLRGRTIRFMDEETDLLIMPDSRLEHLAEIYMTEPREITFTQFVRDRNQSLNNDLYSRRRDLKNQPPAVEALPT